MIPERADTALPVLVEESEVFVFKSLVDDTDDDSLSGEGRFKSGSFCTRSAPMEVRVLLSVGKNWRVPLI